MRPFSQVVLEMDVVQVAVDRSADIGQRQIVRAHQTDGAAIHQRAHDSLGADAAIFRVRALQQFIQEKQQRRISAGQIEESGAAA